MHRALGSLLALSAALSACQVQVAAPGAPKKSPRADEGPRTGASTPPLGVKPAASPGASASPGAGSTAPPTAPPLLSGSAQPGGRIVLDLLQKPSTASTLVSGAVRLDGSYIVAAGAGNILSHNGGQIVAAGGGNLVAAGAGNLVAAGAGNLIGPDGASLVAAGAGNILSHNGGQIVAAGAGNIISQSGGSLVAAGAGNLIGADGASLVAAGAGNILSHNGGQLVAAGAGNLVAAGAGNYRLGVGRYSLGFGGFNLLQAGDGDNGIAKVAGAEVAVRSLRTGEYLPVGVDGLGKPVYVVYTNLEGNYDLYLPEAEQGNVMIEANVNRDLRNPRLEYQNLSGVGQGIDEDVVLVTEVLRRSIATRLRVMFRRNNREEALAALLGNASARIDGVPGARMALSQAFGQVWDVAHEVKLTEEKDQQVLYTYAYAATDAMLRKFDLNAAMIKPGTYWDGEPERAIPALVQIVKQAREGATREMALKPSFVADLPWFQELNRRVVASGRRKAPYQIARPADLGALAIDEFIVVDQDDTRYDFSPPVTDRADCSSEGCQFNLDAFKTALKSVGANGIPLQGVGESGGLVDIAPDGRGEGAARTTKGGWGQVDRLNQAQFEIILQMVIYLLGADPADKDEILGAVRRYATRGSASAPAASPTP